MKNKIKDPWNSNSYDMYCFEQNMQGKLPTWVGYLYWLTFSIREFIRTLYCRKYGHKYENTGGYANGDSGGDYFDCKRCGHSFTHIYY